MIGSPTARFNRETNETTWIDPAAPAAPAQPAAAPVSPWREAQDPGSGRSYWYNAQTNETTWADPSQKKRPPPSLAGLAVGQTKPSPPPL
jgi:hypothetical protein